MRARRLIFGLVLALVLAPAAKPAPVSRTPGPTIAPGSPIVDRTTIAPFPIPGDTSRTAGERAKTMNVPREGVTALAPLGTVGWKQSGSMFYWDPGGLTPPEKISEPVPVYPRAARDAGIQGTVSVLARVRVDGTVGETRILKSIPALDTAAVQSVKRLRLKPALYAGRPVAVWVGVPVEFTLH